MFLDKTTLFNLNIIPKDGNDLSLLGILEKTKTSMGSRLLRQWLLKPLLDSREISSRLDAVEEFAGDMMLKEDVSNILSDMQDIERVVSRVSFKTASPKDVLALRNTILLIPRLNSSLASARSDMLKNKMPEFEQLSILLGNSIKDEPNTIVREGNIIKEGYSKELDELRSLKHDSRQWLLDFEESEKKKTGIKFLRVRFNKVFGYFIEVSNSNLSMVPDYYIRKQTQVNCERYITPELKEKENIILTADEKINELEYNLFMQILDEISKYTADIQEASRIISCIDVLQSFAECSTLNSYVRPILSDSGIVSIVSGRHPVVETRERHFVSNDLSLDEKTRMMIITGPNMAGKSVYIKQNALIILMAQIGCFVPAEKAEIGIVDRIFSRVGASDDISSGHSTFMVEMNETANILSNATDKSFIVLDEIGRGTSTYDGVSLAWSIAEYIATKIRAKALFATHYHHLNKMAGEFDSIRNFNIAVSEKDDEITFIRKIVPGGTDKSYGIHVAKIAGLPKEVIDSSRRIIAQLEMEDEIGDMIHKNIKTGKTIRIEEVNAKREAIQKKLTEL